MTVNDADWRRAIRPAETAFFLDVDGTLLGFKDRPEDVAADDALRTTLRDLSAAAGGAVALVSGRMVVDLDRIMAPLVFATGGVHGADMRYADGRRETFEAAALADVRKVADGLVAAHPALRIEEKGTTTFAVHFRRAPELEATVVEALEAAVTGHDLMLQRGKMVAEVKPRGCHKGLAIDALLQTPPFAGRKPFFIGDDLTDEHGFAAVNAVDGISVKVGSDADPTLARYRVASVEDVRDLLSVICRSAQGTL